MRDVQRSVAPMRLRGFVENVVVTVLAFTCHCAKLFFLVAFAVLLHAVSVLARTPTFGPRGLFCLLLALQLYKLQLK